MRKPCCDKAGTNKGAWSKQEDQKLIDYISNHGEGSWHSLPKYAGLDRCGKSCRLRWINYLRPNIKRGNFGQDEEDLIIKLHALLGNRWSLIAGRLPGRTDNEVKNYWNSHIRKKLLNLGIDPNNHRHRQNMIKLPHHDHHQKVSTNNNNNANSCGSSMNNTTATKVALKSWDHQPIDTAMLSDAASCFEDDHETYNSVAPPDLNLDLTIAFPPPPPPPPPSSSSSSIALEEKQSIKSFNYMPRSEIMNHEHYNTIPNTLFLFR